MFTDPFIELENYVTAWYQSLNPGISILGMSCVPVVILAVIVLCTKKRRNDGQS